MLLDPIYDPRNTSRAYLLRFRFTTTHYLYTKLEDSRLHKFKKALTSNLFCKGRKMDKKGKIITLTRLSIPG